MRRRQILSTISLISVGFFAYGLTADAATLFLQPEQYSVTVGQRFVVELRLDSEKESINAVAATLRYDPELLRPVTIVQDSSFLTLWPEVPAIHEDAQTISLTGGVPGGSVVIDGRVIAVQFEALKAGTAWIGADETASVVLLNDGIGTAAPLTAVPGTYVISTVSPFALPVVSPTHPLEDVWYTGRSVVITWEPRLDAQYSYQLGLNANDLPDDQPELDQDQAKYESVSDGAYYFILSEKLPGDDEWQVVARHRVQVDATAPLAFKPTLRTDVIPMSRAVVFSTTDAASGIDRYELRYGTTVVADASSPFRLPDGLPQGTITVRAYDRAGNVTEGVLTIAKTNTSASMLPLLAAGGVVALAVGFLIIRRLMKR